LEITQSLNKIAFSDKLLDSVRKKRHLGLTSCCSRKISSEANIGRKKKASVGVDNSRHAFLEQERGSFLKKWTGRQPIALIYPNSYKVGMSSLGFQLVYALLNEQETHVCERFFLPERGDSLLSVESGRELSQFPLIFISVSFEHDYLHVVEILRQGGITPLACDRDHRISGRTPLVVCGGVATFMNPEPLAPFVDLFLIGEAEPVLVELTDYLVDKFKDTGRLEVLHGVSRLFEGCYAPALYTPVYDSDGHLTENRPSGDLPARIKKVFLDSCTKAAHSQLLSPLAEFSDLYLTELGRGCSRGCRFCAAGYIYRPPRLWDGDAVAAGIAERSEGVARVGLLGMEMADVSELDTLSEYLGESGCALSFSSLRADKLSRPLLDLLAKSKLKSVAIAPDGCSERLRMVINKGLDEDDIIRAAERLVAAGIYKLKIYLMIGLPTETEEDLSEAVQLVGKIKGKIDPIGRLRGRLCEILISINCFTPKPWTPFQFHPFGISEQLKRGEHKSRQEVVSELKKRLKILKIGFGAYSNVHMSHDKPDNVLFQAVLARGDRRLAGVLLEMAIYGIPWKQAMRRKGLTAEQYALCGFDESDCFPWSIIDHSINQSYLWREYQKAFAGKKSEPCDTQRCRRCGVCHD
jgi:radical SAM superfamily enzyme YgiQ (UPF0313 family)